jgi:hypothetical protein
MLFGALWCIGGIIATVSDLGYIFWGAIVFGAIQFFRGLTSLPELKKVKPTKKIDESIYYCIHCDYEQKDGFEFCPKCLKNDDGLTI